MATAKIATLAIRTLAKPIATQIKHQAAEHQRFRAICISLAQFMHRTEMILRTNLLAPPASSSSSSSSSHSDKKDKKDGSSNSGGSGGGGGGGGGGGSGDGEKATTSSRPKIRPLNEAKAVANGANALAEGFLFVLAAALILGESYRGSRSRAKQRDRTEEGLHELTLLVRALSEKVGPAGVEFEELKRRAEVLKAQEGDVDSDSNGDDGDDEGKDGTSKGAGGDVDERHQTLLQREARRVREDNQRLQHAVSVLLRLALKSGWIQGQEGLRLERILEGTDDEGNKGSEGQKGPVDDGTGKEASSTAKGKPIEDQTSILDQVAQARAKRIAHEVRFGNEDGARGATLDELLAQAQVGRKDSSNNTTQ
ncbi:hypothetical protein FA10DRAFT_264840 [Acaromyces ingoldii]|uniref:OPA3-domain-containing protein n=1 Tax=Acaromyces ingoldii TaxID=215250 RepID=A0A316YXR1_9BASI|nr:hypothetical protein FA10DRAFT_264840 [Acaromyces ingoldii]PWN94300.1 hypothetical protein FA10DRAFT_264840 [Acaromyces ingoldii]